MRLIHFLNEDIFDEIEIRDFKNDILKYCKSWMKAAGDTHIYRGMYKKPQKGKIKVRKDRKPLDTPLDVHNKIDDIFKGHFGWKARSEGVLATGDRSIARSYGIPYRIFPIGNFRFVWSENVHDLYGMYVEYMTKEGLVYAGGGDWKPTLPKYFDPKTKTMKSDDLYLSKKELAVHQKNVFKKLDALIKKEYSDKNIIQAIKSQNEIMIDCKEYYAIEYDKY